MTQETSTNIDLLRSREVAELLRTTAGSVRSAHRRGLIPAPIKLPGLGLRWRRRDIVEWIEAQSRKGAA